VRQDCRRLRIAAAGLGIGLVTLAVVSEVIDLREKRRFSNVERSNETKPITDSKPPIRTIKLLADHRVEGSSIEYVSPELVAQAGLTGFYPERHYYHLRPGHGNIDTYIARATKNVTMVSVNLMTGLAFDGLSHVLEQKLENRQTTFQATISLLDPQQPHLLEAMAPVLDTTAAALKSRIEEALKTLVQFRSTLSAGAKERLELRVHKAIPFGSAIIIDHEEPYGRVQIETKPYKAPHNKSFAFELAPAGETSLYLAIVAGYLALLRDGEIWESTLSN
jgi:hypothetical protein